MRYGRDHTSSSPSSFTSFQLRGVELTTSFEDDALLLETSVASDARGFLEARSIVFKVFASESEETRGPRVSDLRLGAIENGCKREESIAGTVLYAKNMFVQVDAFMTNPTRRFNF